ncbi:MAG TPA: beta-lactamase family protein [Clostridiales bacterium]|nr:beta-lactamase family protein [Clostridiales bacterium]
MFTGGRKVEKILDKKKRLEKALGDVLQDVIDNCYLAGANILVLKNGQEIAYCEAGYSDIENSVKIKRDTIFRLYSMTKPVTGAAMMILLERGLVDLADPVSKYLSGFMDQHVVTEKGMVPVKRNMMIKDLLSMTSGLPYPGEDEASQEAARVFLKIDENLYGDSPLTTRQIANELGKCNLSFHPGEHWMYGTSADILGAVIEVVTDMKYGEFLKKEIFDPLGMEDTAFYVPADKQDRFAKLYDFVDGRFQELKTNNLGIQYQMLKPPAFESGGAGLASTVDDYARFATMLLNYGELNGVRILSKKTVEFFTKGELMSWQQEDLWRNWETLQGYTYNNLMRIMKRPEMSFTLAEEGEYGWDGWLGTYFTNFPESNMTFLFMMQKKDSGTTDLTRRLRNILLKELP